MLLYSYFVHISGYAVAQWLGIRLQMLGVAMVTGVSFIAVLEHHFNTVDPGTVHDCNNVYKYTVPQKSNHYCVVTLYNYNILDLCV